MDNPCQKRTRQDCTTTESGTKTDQIKNKTWIAYLIKHGCLFLCSSLPLLLSIIIIIIQKKVRQEAGKYRARYWQKAKQETKIDR